jgi:hypothetical protein
MGSSLHRVVKDELVALFYHLERLLPVFNEAAEQFNALAALVPTEPIQDLIRKLFLEPLLLLAHVFNSCRHLLLVNLVVAPSNLVLDLLHDTCVV